MVGRDEIIPFLHIKRKDSKVNCFAQVKQEVFTEDEQCFLFPMWLLLLFLFNGPLFQEKRNNSSPLTIIYHRM